MESLLTNPFVQSAVVPFIIAAIAALLLRYLRGYWTGLAVALGFYAAVYLIRGWDLFPLRSTNKILLAGLVAVAVGMVIDLVRIRRSYLIAILFSAAAASALWLVWPRFPRLEGWALWLTGGGALLYAGWMTVAMDGLRSRAMRADSAVIALGMGTGLVSIMGATALYGQLASAIAAAAGACWVLCVLGKECSAGSTMLVAASLLCALLGIGAVVYARLPWYNLALFAAVPLMARLPLPSGWNRVINAVVMLLVCMVPVVVAIYMTWQQRGAPPI